MVACTFCALVVLTGCGQYWLGMQLSIYWILFLHLFASLRCFCPRTFCPCLFEKLIGQVIMDNIYSRSLMTVGVYVWYSGDGFSIDVSLLFMLYTSPKSYLLLFFEWLYSDIVFNIKNSGRSLYSFLSDYSGQTWRNGICNHCVSLWRSIAAHISWNGRHWAVLLLRLALSIIMRQIVDRPTASVTITTGILVSAYQECPIVFFDEKAIQPYAQHKQWPIFLLNINEICLLSTTRYTCFI